MQLHCNSSHILSSRGPGSRTSHSRPTFRHVQQSSRHSRRSVAVFAAAVAEAPAAPAASGHTALLHGLGDVGDTPAALMPWVLRIAAACSHTSGGDSQAAMADISRGISTWRASLNRGLLPDDEAIQQLLHNNEPFTRGVSCFLVATFWRAHSQHTTSSSALLQCAASTMVRVKSARPSLITGCTLSTLDADA